MEALKSFFVNYWAYARWYLIALGVFYLLMALVGRRPGKAFAMLILGIYVTMAAYFLSVREELGFALETSLGMVIIGGLALGALFYYFLFIRSE